MSKSQPRCAHSCKELCTALEIASMNEKSVILQYGALRDKCTYPDVKVMLNDLIIQKKKSIELIENTKELLRSKFEVLDQIREGFEI